MLTLLCLLIRPHKSEHAVEESNFCKALTWTLFIRPSSSPKKGFTVVINDASASISPPGLVLDHGGHNHQDSIHTCCSHFYDIGGSALLDLRTRKSQTTEGGMSVYSYQLQGDAPQHPKGLRRMVARRGNTAPVWGCCPNWFLCRCDIYKCHTGAKPTAFSQNNSEKCCIKAQRDLRQRMQHIRSLIVCLFSTNLHLQWGCEWAH